MKLSRIDQIALNGNDGLHYKYEEVAEKILIWAFGEQWSLHSHDPDGELEAVTKLLVENFPNE